VAETTSGNDGTSRLGSRSIVGGTGVAVGVGVGEPEGVAVPAGAPTEGASVDAAVDAAAAVAVEVAAVEARPEEVAAEGCGDAEAGGGDAISPMTPSSTAARAAMDTTETSPLDPRGRTGGDTSLVNPRIPPHSRG